MSKDKKLTDRLDPAFTSLSTFIEEHHKDYLDKLGGYALLQLSSAELLKLKKEDLRTYLHRATLAYSGLEIMPVLLQYF